MGAAVLGADILGKGSANVGLGFNRMLNVPSNTWGEGLQVATDPTNTYIYVCGTMHFGSALSLPFVNSQFHFAAYIARYFVSTGQLDTRWGSGGYAKITFNDDAIAATDDEATGLAFAANGQLLVAGIRTNRTGSPSMGVFIARLTLTGQLDTTFGTNGYTYTSEDGHDYYSICRVAVQSTGKIILLYNRSAAANIGTISLRRFWPTGLPDESVAPGAGVGTKNLRTTEYLNGKNCLPYGIIVDSNDKVYCTSFTNTAVASQTGIFTCKFASDLTPDTSFGGVGNDSNGVLTTFAQLAGAQPIGIIIRTSGAILVVGQSGYNVGGNAQLTLVQYKAADGTLDTANFGRGTGIFSVDLHTQAGKPDVFPSGGHLELTNGDILIAGGADTASSGGGFSDTSILVMARVIADGSGLSSQYANGNGFWFPKITTTVSTSDIAYGMTLVPGAGDNAVMVGHSMDDVPNPRRANAVVVYVKGDGSGLDTSRGDTSTVFPTVPTATTSAATSIGTNGATLGGTVNGDTAWAVSYGPTIDYGFRTGEQTTLGAVSVPITDRQPGQTVHFRVEARATANGMTSLAWGADTTFTTSAGTATLYSDTYTDVNGTDIRGHFPDINITGNRWDLLANFGGNVTTQIQNNANQATGTSRMGIDCGQVNHTVQEDITPSTGNDNGILTRCSDGINGYLLDFLPGAVLRYYKIVAGAFTSLGTSAATITNGVTVTGKSVMSGNNLTGTLNGGNTLSLSDSTFPSNTKVGSKYDANATIMDNFSITSP